MNGDRWGMDGPPAEAYSRVTDAGRFRPLHDTAVRLLETLEMTFDVWRVEGYGLDEELEEGALARPSIKLTPTDLGAAPLVIAFTAFPASGCAAATGSSCRSRAAAATRATRPRTARDNGFPKWSNT